MIKAVIIDDEQHSIDYLKYVSGQRNDIEVVGEAQNAEMGRREIESKSPSLVFLDIEMPHKDGLELLNEMYNRECNFKIIFTTIHKNYAIDAIKKGAHDYLLKPIDKQEFNEAVDRLFDDDYIRLKNGQLLKLNDIIFIKSEGNDLVYFLKSKEEHPRVRQPFKEVLEILPDSFVQVHRSYIINRNCIKMVNGQSVMMINNTTINISSKMRPELFRNRI